MVEWFGITLRIWQRLRHAWQIRQYGLSVFNNLPEGRRKTMGATSQDEEGRPQRRLISFYDGKSCWRWLTPQQMARLGQRAMRVAELTRHTYRSICGDLDIRGLIEEGDHAKQPA
jgi:hypothetical protein